MILADVIRKRIKYYMELNNMNFWAITKATGVPCSTITSFMDGKSKMIRLDNLMYICNGFNITLKEFFSDERFDDAE